MWVGLTHALGSAEPCAGHAGVNLLSSAVPAHGLKHFTGAIKL